MTCISCVAVICGGCVGGHIYVQTCAGHNHMLKKKTQGIDLVAMCLTVVSLHLAPVWCMVAL